MSPLRDKLISRKKVDPIGHSVFYPSSTSTTSQTSASPASSPIFRKPSQRRSSITSHSTSAPSTPPLPASQRFGAPKQAPAFYIGNMADLPGTPGRRALGGTGGMSGGEAVSPFDLEVEMGRSDQPQPAHEFPFPSTPGTPQLTMTAHSGHFVPPSPTGHSLSDMLQSWNLETPPSAIPVRHTSTFGLPASDSLGSISSLNTEIRSPPDLPSSQGFNSRVLPTTESPEHVLRELSPRPKPARRSSESPRLAIPPTSPYVQGSRSPRSPGPAIAGSPINRSPVPYRQPSWSDTRRGSMPSDALRITTGNPQSPSFQPPSGLYSPAPGSPLGRLPPASRYDANMNTQPTSQFDLFTPGYTMGTAPITPPLSANTLQLSFSVDPIVPSTSRQQNTFGSFCAPPSIQPHAAENTSTTISTHISEPSDTAGSKVAARHLENHILPPRFIEQYAITDELGSGGFGFVCSATMTGMGNEMGREVAVKFIFKERLENVKNALIDDEPMESWVLRQCEHPSIIAWLDLFEDEKYFILVQELHGDPWSDDHTLHASQPETHTDPVRRLSLLQIPSYRSSPSALISPLSPMSIGDINPFDQQSPTLSGSVRPRMGRRASHDLFEAVESMRFTEDEGRWIFKQIVSGVAYLHGRGIYHRDLKDENIVIDRYLNVKIIDFGSAVVENQLHAPNLYGSFRGTYSYASPEVISGSWYRAGPCDVWAIGIILAILLTGEQPFPDQTMALAGRFKLKRPTSEGARDLMEKMFRPDPTRRWGIEKIEKHRWLRNAKRPRGLPQPPSSPSRVAAPSASTGSASTSGWFGLGLGLGNSTRGTSMAGPTSAPVTSGSTGSAFALLDQASYVFGQGGSGIPSGSGRPTPSDLPPTQPITGTLRYSISSQSRHGSA